MARILIVEDDPDIAVNLSHLLISKGYEVTHAADGADALTHARKELPDLILLDVMLPRMSGHDVCKILRAEPRTAKIKVIMVTGLGRGADVEAGLNAGPNDYLVKPFDTQRLLNKIERVLALP